MQKVKDFLQDVSLEQVAFHRLKFLVRLQNLLIILLASLTVICLGISIYLGSNRPDPKYIFVYRDQPFLFQNAKSESDLSFIERQGVIKKYIADYVTERFGVNNNLGYEEMDKKLQYFASKEELEDLEKYRQLYLGKRDLIRKIRVLEVKEEGMNRYRLLLEKKDSFGSTESSDQYNVVVRIDFKDSQTLTEKENNPLGLTILECILD